MNTQKNYRQGDILFVPVKQIPADANKQKRARRQIVALGEATGHHHAVVTTDPADWWKQGDQFYFMADAGAVVTHQEHATIILPAGRYEVRRQREYSPEAIRNVCD